MRAWLAICLILAAQSSHAYDVVAVDGGTTVSGRVVYAGDRPPAAFLPVLKNADVCGERVPDESLLVSPDGGVANAVVELVGVSAGKALPTAVGVLDNEVCAFVPRVQVLAVGQSLEIRNSDPILHDAHAWLGSRTIFNLGLPEWRRVEHVFTEAGVHEVDCNVLHTWMKAWLHVVEHPYASVTAADGRFEITDVPPGEYGLRVWHERLDETEVRVRAPQAERLEVRLPVDQALR